MGSWPAISPVSPGVLCALGDATTRMRTETARSFSQAAAQTSAGELIAILDEMAAQTRAELIADGVPAGEVSSLFEVDVRYAGQAFEVPLTITLDELRRNGVAGILTRFDAEHLRLFTFNMETPHEIVNLRAVAMGQVPDLPVPEIARGDGNPARRWQSGRGVHARTRDVDGWARTHRRDLRSCRVARGRCDPRPGHRVRNGFHHPDRSRMRRHCRPLRQYPDSAGLKET